MCKWDDFHRQMHGAIEGFWQNVHRKLDIIIALLLVILVYLVVFSI